MSRKIANGTRIKLIYGTLPTVDFPNVYNIAVRRDYVAEQSGNLTFIANRNGESNGGTRIKHDEVGKITNSRTRIRLVITDDANLDKAIDEVRERILKAFDTVIDKLEQKKEMARSEFAKAKNGITFKEV